MSTDVSGTMTNLGISWAALAPILVLLLAFLGYCLVDIARRQVKHLPKWAWVIVCCVSIPLGGIIYLTIGRDTSES